MMELSQKQQKSEEEPITLPKNINWSFYMK